MGENGAAYPQAGGLGLRRCSCAELTADRFPKIFGLTRSPGPAAMHGVSRLAQLLLKAQIPLEGSDAVSVSVILVPGRPLCGSQDAAIEAAMG